MLVVNNLIFFIDKYIYHKGINGFINKIKNIIIIKNNSYVCNYFFNL